MNEIECVVSSKISVLIFIFNSQYILNIVRNKYEEFLRGSVEWSTLDSEKAEPLLSEISAYDPEIKKSADDIPSILSKCFYVDDSKRFKCGIMQCKRLFSEKDFSAHLEVHDPNHAFICVHCETNVGYCRVKAFHHMYWHFQHLYYCVTCEYVRSSRFLMVLHFLRKHLDVDVQFWYKDQIRNETKLVNPTYLCKECAYIGVRVSDLAGHFYDYHESQMVDFKVAADLRSNQLLNKYLVRKQVICTRCHSSYGTKGELIQHHRNKHMPQQLNVKLGDLSLLPIKHMSKQQIEIYTENNAKNDRNIIFHCRNCNDDGANLFDNVCEIYNHWDAKHKPNDFKFEIDHLIGCHYCEFISNFREIKQHQSIVHQHSSLAIKSFLNPEKCGICNKKVSDIAEHWKKEHQVLQYTKVIDPVHMNEDLLLELSTFHCDSSSVQYIITGCCFEEVPATMNALLYHILCHLEPIICTRCTFSSSDGFKFAKHNCVQTSGDILTRFRHNLHDIFFGTRIVFKNGLTVTRANLIGTGYDNDQSFAFDIFINEMMNIHEGGAN